MSESILGKPLPNTGHRIRYQDGIIRTIIYPPNCNRLKGELGDYCWGLATAYDNRETTEFAKNNCPCGDF